LETRTGCCDISGELCFQQGDATAHIAHKLTLQRGGFKHPVHTVVWEGFSSGHLNFELNLQEFIQNNVVLLIVVGF
jgi:hypothetical protein